MTASTQQTVEAALLNSEGEPEQEVLAALQAIIWFAKLECEATDIGLRDLFEKALKSENDAT